MFSASWMMASSVAGGCFCLKVGEREALVWGDPPDRKASLTTSWMGTSPWGCHMGLLACILPTGGCQSLHAPGGMHPTSARALVPLLVRQSVNLLAVTTHTTSGINPVLHFVRLPCEWCLSTGICPSACGYLCSCACARQPAELILSTLLCLSTSASPQACLCFYGYME